MYSASGPRRSILRLSPRLSGILSHLLRACNLYARFHFLDPRDHLLLSNVDPGRVLLAKELDSLEVVIR